MHSIPPPQPDRPRRRGHREPQGTTKAPRPCPRPPPPTGWRGCMSRASPSPWRRASSARCSSRCGRGASVPRAARATQRQSRDRPRPRRGAVAPRRRRAAAAALQGAPAAARGAPAARRARRRAAHRSGRMTRRHLRARPRAAAPDHPPLQWGAVRDIMILREQPSGVSRGCAFVGYTAAEDAQAAIQHLNARVQLPGAAGPLEVRARRRPGGRRPAGAAAAGWGFVLLPCPWTDAVPSQPGRGHNRPARLPTPGATPPLPPRPGALRAQPPLRASRRGPRRQPPAVLLARAAQRPGGGAAGALQQVGAAASGGGGGGGVAGPGPAQSAQPQALRSGFARAAHAPLAGDPRLPRRLQVWRCRGHQLVPGARHAREQGGRPAKLPGACVTGSSSRLCAHCDAHACPCAVAICVGIPLTLLVPPRATPRLPTSPTCRAAAW
jgi:hypothetical protein